MMTSKNEIEIGVNMRELYFGWLPVLGVILGGTMLFTGLLVGVSRSLKQIYGYSNDLILHDAERELGIIPLFFLRIGIFSVIGGFLWLHFVHNREYIIYVMIVGGVFGLFSSRFARRMHQLAEEGDLNKGIVTELGRVGGIIPIMGGLVLMLIYIIIGGIVGGVTGGILGLLAGFVTNIAQSSVGNLITSGMTVGGTVGGIGGGIRGVKAGMKIGGWIVGEIAGWFAAGGIIGGVAGGVMVGIRGIIPSALTGTIIGGMAYGVPLIVLPIEWGLARIISSVMTPLIILLKFKTIICNNCLRYTRPLMSKYNNGIRYCERCRKEVEFTKDPGEVFLMFGNVALQPEGRVFMLSDPDFEQRTKFIEISRVYIDTKTCDKRLLERFITYIINYPPERGIQAVQILYRGEFDDLGANLKNALRNNFAQIEKIQEI